MVDLEPEAAMDTSTIIPPKSMHTFTHRHTFDRLSSGNVKRTDDGSRLDLVNKQDSNFTIDCTQIAALTHPTSFPLFGSEEEYRNVINY